MSDAASFHPPEHLERWNMAADGMAGCQGRFPQLADSRSAVWPPSFFMVFVTVTVLMLDGKNST
jgi:hypothetical protein